MDSVPSSRTLSGDDCVLDNGHLTVRSSPVKRNLQYSVLYCYQNAQRDASNPLCAYGLAKVKQ